MNSVRKSEWERKKEERERERERGVEGSNGSGVQRKMLSQRNVVSWK